jgi:hypothetical protein
MQHGEFEEFEERGSDERREAHHREVEVVRPTAPRELAQSRVRNRQAKTGRLSGAITKRLRVVTR